MGWCFGFGLRFKQIYIARYDNIVSAVPWLIIFSLALLPIGRLAEIPLCILAIIGIGVASEKIKNGAWGNASLLFSLFFICFWIPIVISVSDSFNLSKSLSLSVEYLRFFLSGIAVVECCASSFNIKLITRYSALIVTSWILFGVVYFLFGKFLSAALSMPHWLNDVFSQRFGLSMITSVCSVFVLLITFEKRYLFIGLLLNVLCVIVLLLGGSRGAWIMYCVAVIYFLYNKLYADLKKFATVLIALIGCIVVVGICLNYSSARFASRISQTVEIFKGDEKSVDIAISKRVPIWKTAVSMISAHPVNGVGARAFRYAYPTYAEEKDTWVVADGDSKRKIGADHSHQMQLEVLSETGIVGGIFFLSAIMILFRYWRSRTETQKGYMLPYVIGMAAIFFPLNTHPALYSSSWAQVIYWFVTLFFAAGAIEEISDDPERSALFARK